MAQRIYDVIAGSTKKLTWVSSGVTPGTIACSLRDRGEALINSVAATASGNGAYFAVVPHPTSYGGQWVVNEWVAVINGNTYVNRQFGKITTWETD
jgi:hypothetical protein